MTPGDWQRIQKAFSAALLAPETHRKEYLERTLADSPLLAKEALEMLSADRNGTGPLDCPAICDGDAEWFAGIDRDAFRPYRVLRPLGSGGMGVVLLAERADGKPVAIKILRKLAASAESRRRFIDEIEALGSLEHANIARLYHADATRDGTPWFAMEYVRGVPLDEYCRAGNRSLQEILDLFRQICEAVQHAHSLGIIHRDLKPSNILVKADGGVKLLDFGIAKQLDRPEARETAPGRAMLTLPYAAPEQIRGERPGTYTDVYSLGLIFYEMLAGNSAFNLDGLEWAEAQRTIMETAPRPPSLRAREAGRFVEIGRGAWRDLDALCAAGMEKDPRIRYRSAGDLLRDLGRFVAGEPLEARRPSFIYQLSKFVKRRRAPVLAGAAALIFLIGFTSFFTLRLERSREAALAEAARTRRLQKFITSIFEAGDEKFGPSKDLKVMTLLDNAVREADSLARDPLQQADIYNTLGAIFLETGQLDRAESLLKLSLARRRAAQGTHNPETAESLVNLGLVRSGEGRYKEGEKLVREGLATAQQTLGPGDPRMPQYEAALGGILSEEGNSVGATVALLKAMRLQSRRDESEDDLGDTLNLLATNYINSGEYEKAETYTRQAIDIDIQKHGVKSAGLAYDLTNLGYIEYYRRDFRNAENTYRKALNICKAWYGENNPETADLKRILAQDLIRENRLSEAAVLGQEALTTLQRAYGSAHPRVALSLNLMGQIELERGECRRAATHLESAVAIFRKNPENDYIALALSNLGSAYLKCREYRNAEQSFAESLRAFGKPPSNGAAGVARSELGLGEAILRQRRYRQAEEPLLSSYQKLQSKPGLAQEAKRASSDLALVYTALGRRDKAAAYGTGKDK